MKIRTDFVTNSSSSSFSLVLTVEGVNGKSVTFTDTPYWEDGGSAGLSIKLCDLMLQSVVDSFHRKRDVEYELTNMTEEGRTPRAEKLKEGDPLRIIRQTGIHPITKKKYTYHDVVSDEGSVGLPPPELLQRLTPFLKRKDIIWKISAGTIITRAMRGKGARKASISIRVDAEMAEGAKNVLFTKDLESLAKMLMDSEENSSGKPLTKKKQAFLSQMKSSFSSLDQIEKIVMQRDYSAWGEFADLIPENDRKLQALTKAVILSDGEERQRSIQEMREYVMTPNAERQMNFGAGYDDFRYACETDDESLLRIAKRICSHHGVNSVEGHELEEINLQTGKSQAYAEFNLQPYAECKAGSYLDQLTVEQVRELMTESKQKEDERLRKIGEDRQRFEKEVEEKWLRENSQLLTSDPSVEISGHTFVFTGLDVASDEEYYREEITARGGYFRSSVSGKTDYLVINLPWPGESKIKAAQAQQANGKKLQIILIRDLIKALG